MIILILVCVIDLAMLGHLATIKLGIEVASTTVFKYCGDTILRCWGD